MTRTDGLGDGLEPTGLDATDDKEPLTHQRSPTDETQPLCGQWESFALGAQLTDDWQAVNCEECLAIDAIDLGFGSAHHTDELEVARAAVGAWHKPTPEPLACYDCLLPYGGPGWCDAVVPNHIWAQISPRGDSAEGGVLCVTCMARRLQALGVTNVPLKVTSGPFKAQDRVGLVYTGIYEDRRVVGVFTDAEAMKRQVKEFQQRGIGCEKEWWTPDEVNEIAGAWRCEWDSEREEMAATDVQFGSLPLVQWDGQWRQTTDASIVTRYERADGSLYGMAYGETAEQAIGRAQAAWSEARQILTLEMCPKHARARKLSCWACRGIAQRRGEPALGVRAQVRPAKEEER